MKTYISTAFPPLSPHGFLSSSCRGPFTEAVRLSDPGMHQTLHRSQLAAKARQSSFSQRPSGEGGQGNDSDVVLTCWTFS